MHTRVYMWASLYMHVCVGKCTHGTYVEVNTQVLVLAFNLDSFFFLNMECFTNLCVIHAQGPC